MRQRRRATPITSSFEREGPASIGRYHITHLEQDVLLLKHDGRPLTNAEGNAVQSLPRYGPHVNRGAAMRWATGP